MNPHDGVEDGSVSATKWQANVIDGTLFIAT